MSFDPSKLEGLDLELTTEEKAKVQALAERIENLSDQKFDELMEGMEEVIASANRREAFLNNAEFIAKLTLVLLGALA